MADNGMLVLTMLFLKRQLEAIRWILSVPSGAYTLGFAAIVFFGVSSLTVFLFPSFKENPSKIVRCQGKTTIEQLKHDSSEIYTRYLVSGVVVGSISALISTQFNPTYYNLSAWVIVAGQSYTTLAGTSPRQRFLLGLNGAAMAILILLLMLHELSIENRKLCQSMQVIQIVSALSTICGFLSIPRRPDNHINGRLIDRQYSCSISAFLTFTWSRGLFDIKNVSKIAVADLPMLDFAARAQHLTQQHILHNQLSQRILWIALAKNHISSLILQWSLTILKAVTSLAPKFVILRLLQQLAAADYAGNRGLYLAISLGLCKIFDLWINSFLQWITFSRIQVPIKATLYSLLYRKALRLPDIPSGSTPTNRPQKPTITLQIDSAKACVVFTDTNHIPLLIARFTSTTIFLINLVGRKSYIAGLIASIFVMPFTTVLAAKHNMAQSKLSRHRNERSTLVADALLVIRQIKLSATEETWEKRIFQSRNQECEQLFLSIIWSCGLVFIANLSPILIAGVPLYVFALEGNQLTASIAFTSITLFQQLQSDIASLPFASGLILEAWASLRRLETYFAERETVTPLAKVRKGVSFQNATVTWFANDNGKDEFTLNNLSLEFPHGELSIVTGATGSGKSLLLLAIAGEAKVIEGTIEVPQAGITNIRDQWVSHGKLAVVSQSPWMQNTTIKDNILFGLPFDSGRYHNALNSCLLHKDLDALENGDLTLVGPKGAALSGGQRWRVALARALYSQAGILLLDDILSAVDAEVREHLAETISRGELAKGRTRILATHQASQCQEKAAYIVHLHNCKVQKQEYLSPATKLIPGNSFLELSKQEEVRDSAQTKANKKTAHSVIPPLSKSSLQPKLPLLSPYKTYFRAVGGIKSCFLAASVAAVYEALDLTNSQWLKNWTAHGNHNHNHSSVAYYGTVYLLICLLNCLLSAARGIVWSILGTRASTSLFEKMTCSLFGTHLQWLEETSHGEIMIRFTSDMNAIDNQLPHDSGHVIGCLYKVVTILITSTSISLYTTCFALLILYAYYKIGMRLLFATRKLKEVSSTAYATLFQQLADLRVPEGILTIRTYGKSDYFINRAFLHIDNASSGSWYHMLCRIMMNFHLGVLGALFVTSVALAAVLTRADAGSTGIALEFAMQFSTTMSILIQEIVGVESGLSSVNRISEYGRLPAESLDGIEPPAAWPSEGQVQVDRLIAGYHISLPAVLDEMSFSIGAGQHVGIVGRTGAGKSSLIMAFLRLIQQRQGSIMIDGIDISNIQPRILRRRLFIIPQDPYISSGSLRSTLDPGSVYDDLVLKNALKKVHLIAVGGTDQCPFADLSLAISEGGANISQGQRQLLYLAKALLSRQKLIIMDEATSAVDAITDAAIQATIREGLPNSTVITVAHRLATIADFNKILVLEGGNLVEVGSPADLLRQEGYFWKLVCCSPDKDQLVEKILKAS